MREPVEHLGGEVIHQPEFRLESNPDLLGFDTIQPAGFDDRDRELVDVYWPDGSVKRQIYADTPAFWLTPPDKRDGVVVLTLERAAHIKDLHIDHTETGSFFTPEILDDYSEIPVTLELLMERVADNLRLENISGSFYRRTVEFKLDKICGREGVAALHELYARGVISDEDIAAVRSFKDAIIAANESLDPLEKQACVDDFHQLYGNTISNIDLKVIREAEGGVVVLHAFDIPQQTDRMMIELTGHHGTNQREIHTIAAGRAMPRHPIRALHRFESGVADQRSFATSAYRWTEYAHIETTPDQPPYIERTINHLKNGSFIERYIHLATKQERQCLQAIEQQAHKRAKRYAMGIVLDAAARRIETTPARARARSKTDPEFGRQWQSVIQSMATAVMENTAGKQMKHFLHEVQHKKLTSEPAYQAAVEAATKLLEQATEQRAQDVMGLIDEIEQRRHDPAFIEALALWASTPDSQRDRAYDGKGYNAGLIHFIEYRAAKDKAGRFRLTPEPATVDGFIAYSERLATALESIGSDDPSNANLVALMEDTQGNRRAYILLPGGDIIVAFQGKAHDSLKLTATFPRVRERYFLKAVHASLSGNDRGQVNKLGQDVRLIAARGFRL